MEKSSVTRSVPNSPWGLASALLVGLIMLSLLPAVALAQPKGSVTINVTGTPLDPKRKDADGNSLPKLFPVEKIPIVQVIIGGKDDPNRRVIDIPWGGGTAAAKATVIAGGIFSFMATDPKWPYPTMTVTAGAASITLGGLPAKVAVSFLTGASGEVRDSKFTRGDPFGAIGFRNDAFASIDGINETSSFTGGVITDFGELSFTLLASDLPALDGATIVGVLFDLLDPVIDSFGTDIIDYTDGDDSLLFFFDPARTELAGVVFGTSAETAGVFGCLQVGTLDAVVPPGPASCDPGVTVPEPSTYLMLLAGLGILGFVAGRRKAFFAIGCEIGDRPRLSQSC